MLPFIFHNGKVDPELARFFCDSRKIVLNVRVEHGELNVPVGEFIANGPVVWQGDTRNRAAHALHIKHDVIIGLIALQRMNLTEMISKLKFRNRPQPLIAYRGGRNGRSGEGND